jgi:hypothetical protein
MDQGLAWVSTFSEAYRLLRTKLWRSWRYGLEGVDSEVSWNPPAFDLWGFT